MHQNSIRMRPRSPTMTSAWSLSWNIGISAAWMHMNAPIDCRWFIHRGAISMVHKQDVQMIITIPTQPLYFFYKRALFLCFFAKRRFALFLVGFCPAKESSFQQDMGWTERSGGHVRGSGPIQPECPCNIWRILALKDVKSIAPYRDVILRGGGATLVQKKRPAAVPVIWSSFGP